MTDIVYQYVSNGWDELRYSLRSIGNFVDAGMIFIIGDCPVWTKNIFSIQHSRLPNREQDTIGKFYATIANNCVSDSFVWMHDDIYFLRKTSLAFLKKPSGYPPPPDAVLNRLIRHGSFYEKKLLAPTIAFLKSKGLPCFIYETHLPRVYEKEKLRWILETYKIAEDVKLISTCYHNTFYKEPEILLNESLIKAGFYGYQSRDSFSSKTKDNVIQATKDRYFLNHNDAGLTPPLKEFIAEIFSKPSCFENQDLSK